MRKFIALLFVTALCYASLRAANPAISRVQLIPLSNYLNSVWLQLSNISFILTNTPYTNITGNGSFTFTNDSVMAKNVPFEIKSSDGVVMASFSYNSYAVSFPQVSSGELLFLSGGILSPSGVSTDGSGVISVTDVIIIGTTNQLVFGATNLPPAITATPAKWISVQVSGDAGVYRLPLYQ